MEQYEATVRRWKDVLFGRYREERQIIIQPKIILHLRFFSKREYDLGFFGLKHKTIWRYILLVIKIWPAEFLTY